jgi:hypothetical protein
LIAYVSRLISSIAINCELPMLPVGERVACDDVKGTAKEVTNN